MSDVAQAVVPPPVYVRDELRASHRLRQEAMRNHEHAVAAERRGQALLSDAEHELAEIEQAETTIAAQMAAQIAQDIASGQPAPDLPPRPAGWHERREIARDRVSAARQAHRQLGRVGNAVPLVSTAPTVWALSVPRLVTLPLGSVIPLVVSERLVEGW